MIILVNLLLITILAIAIAGVLLGYLEGRLSGKCTWASVIVIGVIVVSILKIKHGG